MKKVHFLLIILAACAAGFSSCGSHQNPADLSDLPAVYAAPTVDSTVISFTAADSFNHAYNTCSGKPVSVKRYKPRPGKAVFAFEKPGRLISSAEYLDSLRKNNILVYGKSKSVATEAVDPPNGATSEVATPSKPWDFSWVGNFIKAVLGVAGVIFIILLAIAFLWFCYRLLKKLFDADSLNNGGGNRRDDYNNDPDDRPSLIRRNSGGSGSGRGTPLANVRETTITETRTTVHKY